MTLGPAIETKDALEPKEPFEILAEKVPPLTTLHTNGVPTGAESTSSIVAARISMVTTFKTNAAHQSSRQAPSLGTFPDGMSWNTAIETNHFLIASFVVVIQGTAKAAWLGFGRVLTICFIVSHFPATIANGGNIFLCKSVQHGLRTRFGTWDGRRSRPFRSQGYPQLSSAKFLEVFDTIMGIVF